MEDQRDGVVSGTEVIHPQYGSGWVVECKGELCTVDFSIDGRKVVRVGVLQRPGGGTLEPPIDPMDMARFLRSLKKIVSELKEDDQDVKMADRWRGGTLILKPKSPELKPKELPLDTLFHKVVMVRERLRVLEQNINNHPKLDDADRLELQQYLTRAYGSLTTFNLLFADKEDGFMGQKGGKGSGEVEEMS